MNLKQNADCVYTSLERVDELKECVHEFFTKYLNHVEESDSGRLFNPVTIGCCRALMLEPLNEVLERMRVLSGADRNPLSTDGIDGARVAEVGIWGEKEANRSQATTSAFISNHKPVAYEVGADVINSQGQFEYRTFLAYRPDPAMTTGGRHEVTKVLEARPLYTAPPSIEAAVLAEREACAKVCDEILEHTKKLGNNDAMLATISCAVAILARGEK